MRRERINTTGADHKRQLNRAEHLRQHVKPTTATASPTAATGTREDSESLNSTLDRALDGGRTIAYTAIRQLTVNLEFAIATQKPPTYTDDDNPNQEPPNGPPPPASVTLSRPRTPRASRALRHTRYTHTCRTPGTADRRERY